MNSSTLTVKISKQLKEKAKKRCQEEGVSMTFAVNQLLEAFVEFEIDFEMKIKDDFENNPRKWLDNDRIMKLRKRK